MKIFVTTSLLIGACVALFSVALWRLTDGFSLSHIQSNLTYSPRWDVPHQDEKNAHHLLAQNFYYIGRGSQSYVFESEDHDVVLKFFRYPRYRLNSLTRLFSSPAFLADIQRQKMEDKQQKLDALFLSCLIAYQELKEESALIYLHLNKTTHLKQTVVLYDKLKRPLPINIDDYEFIIQKKGEHIFPYLNRLLEKGKRKEAEAALADLASLLCSRIQKGIQDDDAVIHKNMAFRHQQAFFLDLGGFSHDPISDPYVLWNVTGQLRTWLQRRDPQLAIYFENTLENHVSVRNFKQDSLQ